MQFLIFKKMGVIMKELLNDKMISIMKKTSGVELPQELNSLKAGKFSPLGGLIFLLLLLVVEVPKEQWVNFIACALVLAWIVVSVHGRKF